jgi:nucleotide-binding universal stress UspA family protein
MKTILVAYDDTEPSRRALARVATLAEAFGSRVLFTSIAPLHYSLQGSP